VGLLNVLRRHFGWVDRIGQQVSDPVKWRRLNGWLVIFWTGMFFVAYFANLVALVVFISYLSIYANWATHLGAWAASRAEVSQTETLEESVCKHCGKK
jgi:hypothetical protein